MKANKGERMVMCTKTAASLPSLEGGKKIFFLKELQKGLLSPSDRS